jgi:hypothetical protein
VLQVTTSKQFPSSLYSCVALAEKHFQVQTGARTERFRLTALTIIDSDRGCIDTSHLEAKSEAMQSCIHYFQTSYTSIERWQGVALASSSRMPLYYSGAKGTSERALSPSAQLTTTVICNHQPPSQVTNNTALLTQLTPTTTTRPLSNGHCPEVKPADIITVTRDQVAHVFS